MAQTGWLDPEISPQQLLDRQIINGADELSPLYGEVDAAGPPGAVAQQTGWLGRELSPQQILDRELITGVDMLSPLYAEAGIVAGAALGDLAQNLPLTLTANGTVLVQGTLSQAVALGLSASATVLVQGSLSQTLALGFTASGTVLVQGALSLPLPLSLSADGAVTNAGANGDLNQALSLTLAADGTVLVQGDLASTLPLGLVADATAPKPPGTGGPKLHRRRFELDIKPTKRGPLPPQKPGPRRISSVKVALSLSAPTPVMMAEVSIVPLSPIAVLVRLPQIVPPSLSVQGQITTLLGLANERIDELEAILLASALEDD